MSAWTLTMNNKKQKKNAFFPSRITIVIIIIMITTTILFIQIYDRKRMISYTRIDSNKKNCQFSFFFMYLCKVQYLSMKPFSVICFFYRDEGIIKKRRNCYFVIWIESQTTLVYWPSNGYLSASLYKQTVIHCWMNKNKQILSLTWKILLPYLTVIVYLMITQYMHIHILKEKSEREFSYVIAVKIFTQNI